MNRSGGFFRLPIACSALEVMLAELRGGPFLRHGFEDAVVVLAVVLPIGRTGLIAANELVLAVNSSRKRLGAGLLGRNG